MMFASDKQRNRVCRAILPEQLRELWGDGTNLRAIMDRLASGTLSSGEEVLVQAALTVRSPELGGPTLGAILTRLDDESLNRLLTLLRMALVSPEALELYLNALRWRLR